MRPIYLVRLDKLRPAVLLTNEETARFRERLTFAPITSTVRGLASEVPVGTVNGVDHDSVINTDTIETVLRSRVGRLIGYLLDEQETALAEAIAAAFDLEI